ncbi:MAG: AAA family ATPase [Syntrophorhabdaceae bacterium]
MRIDRLDLIAYGPFTSRSLDLSMGEAGLHVIYGNNESGKSTSLRSLIAWLFGIPGRTNDNFLHGNPQLRIGGKLRLKNGDSLEFVRRKGTKGTLLRPGTDEVMDDSALAPFLSGISENLFQTLYGIDHDRLVAGGQALLSQSGDLGKALFSAASGIANLRGILTGLESSADELFRSKASTRLINQAITQYKESQKRIREFSVPVAEWTRLQNELDDTLSAILDIEADINRKSKEKNRLDRIYRVNSALAERRTIMAQIGELSGVLVLPEDFQERCKAAIDNLHKTREAEEKAKTRLARLTKESESANYRPEFLENEKTILEIYRELGAVQKMINDRPQQEGRRRLLRNEAEKLLKMVRPDLSMNDAETLRPVLNNKKWIAGLAQKHSLLNQKKETIETTLKDLEDEKKRIRQELGEQYQSRVDIEQLSAATATARKAGNVERRLEDARKKLSDEQRACDSELVRLGRYTGTLEALSTIAVPVLETLDIFDRNFSDITEDIKDHRRKQTELTEELKKLEYDLNVLLLKKGIPTVGDLEHVRGSRDTGWQLIKKKYIENGNVEKEIGEFAPGENISTVYEQRVHDADIIADTLRFNADDVVKRADLENRIAGIRNYLAETANRINELVDENRKLQQEWTAIWTPLRVDPGTPREMKQWIVRLEKLQATACSAGAVSGEVAGLLRECSALKENLSREISRFDPSINREAMGLEAMLDLCEQHIEKEKNFIQRKKQLDYSLSELEIRRERAGDDLQLIQDEMHKWIKEWEQAIKGLGLQPDVHPEHATEIFEQLMAFFRKYDESEEVRKRIYGMDQVEEGFTKAVFEFTNSIHLDMGDQDAKAVAEQLNEGLYQAREIRAGREEIRNLQNDVKDEIENYRITIRLLNENLSALKAQARVSSDEDLLASGELSATRRLLQVKLTTLDQELARNGDGLSIDDLQKEADESDIDNLTNNIETIASGLRELHARRDELRDHRQTLQNEIAAKDGSSVAANASEDAQGQLAVIISGTERYLRLKIAAMILDQQIEDYRKKNQAPVLSRAGEVFALLTCGSFKGLRDELDGMGNPVLLGVRPDNTEVPVEGMSDGTRDQLYLSLRLATVEKHLVEGEPMPFIVDDILIGFDDQRTKVGLETLADLGGKTQVLLFTHHSRVVELAREIKARAGVYVHELGY